MTQVLPAFIVSFEHSLFIAVMLKLHDHPQIKHMLQIEKYPIGIQNQIFINRCFQELSNFKNRFDYNDKNLELNYKIKFCYLDQKNDFALYQKPLWGSNVVYISSR